MNMEKLIADLQVVQDKTDEFAIGLVTEGYDGSTIAAAMIQLGMQMYKTILDEESYNTLMNTIYETRGKISKMFPDEMIDEARRQLAEGNVDTGNEFSSLLVGTPTRKFDA